MLNWSSWKPLPLTTPFTEQTLAETLNGGQAFRWNFLPAESCWQGIWGQHAARIRFYDTTTLHVSTPRGNKSTPAALATYLRADFDWEAAVDSLPWRSDPHLHKALLAYPGLRILKQPFPEAVLCFLCSATKQIPQIKVMCERMAKSLGNEIIPGIHALPTWEQLAAASEAELRALGLGFRAKNIKKTADLLASSPQLLAQIEAAPYPEAKAQLVTLPGVGEKIADCALLFGAAKLEAFPVDTWIIKVLEKRYALSGWTPPQLSQFGRVHYGPLAGFAQQFIFSYERKNPA
ncbi:DNA glycosylase [Pelagicoccus sp. SDUM812005]|uniref:DNA glycosylase n=1 Tax=Pelagicoccus sp. SDUM812005 TaxID=3041257 RepID=UPI00280DE7FE|nr:DNA glycosylase [Pelagicoccus sp. SDUM812005]MDQ8181785.1 DNA glycosylase [Pelagicoccus sp. SDUM812005]